MGRGRGESGGGERMGQRERDRWRRGMESVGGKLEEERKWVSKGEKRERGEERK
jgi:hypothetical protein